MKEMILLGLIMASSLISFDLPLSSMQAVAQVEAKDPDEEFRAFCDRTMRNLERARERAGNSSRSGKFADSVKLLLDGLSQNLTTYGDLNPITFKLIAHSLDVGRALEREAGNDLKGIKATTIALESLYDLIFETNRKVDYVHYRCSFFRRSCRYSQTLEFERNVLDMVRSLLTLSNRDLIITRGTQIFPIGPTSIYLNAVNMTASTGYSELREMVTSTAYSCEILDLKELSEDLTYFNQGSNDERSKRQKMYEVYSDLSAVIHSLGTNRCH